MRCFLTLVTLAIVWHSSAQQSQSQAQDFIVTAKDTPKGLIVRVNERDSGRLLLDKVTESISFNGDLDKGRKVALGVTSQNSGPNMLIASGGFVIISDKLNGAIYEAVVHRARPEEIRRVTEADGKQSPKDSVPLATGVHSPSGQDDSITIKFAEKIGRYELPLPSQTIDHLLVSSKTKNEWTFIIRAGPVTKRTIATCDSYQHNDKFSDGCNVQVGQVVTPIFPTKQNEERFSYISEIGDSLYFVDGSLDNYVVQAFKVIKSEVVSLKTK
jgi:hypothetical protein